MTKIAKNLGYEWNLNEILSWLDNHQKEYLKLFRVGRIEIEKLLELHKQRIIEEIVKNYKDISLFEIWSESFEVKKLSYDDKKQYIAWYNGAVKEINKRVKDFSDNLENLLQHII